MGQGPFILLQLISSDAAWLLFAALALLEICLFVTCAELLDLVPALLLVAPFEFAVWTLTTRSSHQHLSRKSETHHMWAFSSVKVG